MREISLVLVLPILFIVFTFCADDGNDNSGLRPIETTLTLTDGNGDESSVFSKGDHITFIIQMRNRTAELQILRFSSGQHYDIEVHDFEDILVWNWAHDKAFIQSQTELVFTPNEVKTFEETWDQVNNDGVLTSPGTYNAYVTHASGSEYIAGPCSFEIE
jgi:hypothetical protein